ncbi:hypothetical protein ATPR_1296 [Acetobacter tropicalis NBRC 101654]|uniref:Uncharacterized protein n=1 Tax=Acetobacter tropicalis NBRC 101654 TaxID=749388 RepID=F7VD47_9PROT|nr:hypothetical protein ATPR_1296 [Acetobacter tropicalis NBRC 101654]
MQDGSHCKQNGRGEGFRPLPRPFAADLFSVPCGLFRQTVSALPAAPQSR